MAQFTKILNFKDVFAELQDDAAFETKEKSFREEALYSKQLDAKKLDPLVAKQLPCCEPLFMSESTSIQSKSESARKLEEIQELERSLPHFNFLESVSFAEFNFQPKRRTISSEELLAARIKKEKNEKQQEKQRNHSFYEKNFVNAQILPAFQPRQLTLFKPFNLCTLRQMPKPKPGLTKLFDFSCSIAERKESLLQRKASKTRLFERNSSSLMMNSFAKAKANIKENIFQAKTVKIAKFP